MVLEWPSGTKSGANLNLTTIRRKSFLPNEKQLAAIICGELLRV
jgi:hypothetical protein